MERIVTKRISYIDQLKGIAIFLVVLGHLIGHNAGSGNGLWTFIYSFHMPLFMFISGYLASVTSTEEALSWSKIGRTILKKSRTLLLPSLTWGIAIPYLLLEKTETSLPSVINDWLQIWGGGLWFLNTLFVLSLLFLLYKAVVQRLRNQSLWVHLLVLGGVL